MMPIPKEQGCTAIEFTNNIEFFAPGKYYNKNGKNIGNYDKIFCYSTKC